MRRGLNKAGIIAAAVVALSSLSTAAFAQDEEIVGILQVDVVGVSETAAEIFESSLEDGLGNAGFNVAKRVRMRELLRPSGFIEGCTFGPCLQKIFEITGVKLVLVARITGVGKNFTYLVTLVDTRTGALAAQETDTCAVCTVDEAVATASMAVIGLVTGAGKSGVEPDTPATASLLDLAAIREREAAMADLMSRRKRSVKRGAVLLLSMAGIAGAVSATGFFKDDDRLGYSAAGVAGGFAISGATLLVISSKF